MFIESKLTGDTILARGRTVTLVQGSQQYMLQEHMQRA